MHDTLVASRSLHARRLALKLMDKHGLHDWGFAFNRGKRRAGVCFYPLCNSLVNLPGRIELSVYHCELNPVEVVRDTILHELAHALVGPGHGHGEIWKAKCVEIGAKPERCFDADEVNMPRGPWQARCFSCGKHFHRHRRPKSLVGYFCKACGPEKGQLYWAYYR